MRFVYAVLLFAGLLFGQRDVGPVVRAGWPKAFDVVSIKARDPSQPLRWMGERPEAGGRLTAMASPESLLMFALNLKQDQIVGLPGWANDKLYSIKAVAAPGAPELPERQNAEMERPMVLAMLRQYFHLEFHRTSQPMGVLDLVVAKGGPKLKDAPDAEVAALNAAGANPGASPWRMRGGKLISNGGRMQDLADGLSFDLQKMVIDKTGLTGNYDYTVTWTPGPGERMRGGPRASGPSLYTALPSQIGLQLKSAKEPVAMVFIDHIEPPASGN